MKNQKERFVTENDPIKIKELVRIGAIDSEVPEARIPLLEAAYLAEKGIIQESKQKIIESLKKIDELAEEKYAILKYLSDLGYVVRASLDDGYMRVHEKGIKRGEDRTRYVLKVVKPTWNPTLKEINEMVEFAAKVRKELIIAYVEDKKFVFYKIDRKKF